MLETVLIACVMHECRAFEAGQGREEKHDNVHGAQSVRCPGVPPAAGAAPVAAPRSRATGRSEGRVVRRLSVS